LRYCDRNRRYFFGGEQLGSTGDERDESDVLCKDESRPSGDPSSFVGPLLLIGVLSRSWSKSDNHVDSSGAMSDSASELSLMYQASGGGQL